jgi:paired amphipathic helix protein Sin3a
MASYMQASYVLDTEDFLFRVRKRRRVSSIGTIPGKADIAKAADAVKAQRFHRFLSRP